jgi:hypothetical protein
LTTSPTRGIINTSREIRKDGIKMMDKMIDEVVRKYGFEARQTIGFCKMVEEVERGNLAIERVKARYEWLMKR